MPLDFIIGGPKMAGQGWRMLVEQLSVGRCISLPSNATGGAKAGVFASGAYTPHPPPVQHAGGQVRGRRSRARAHGGLHLHHGRGALGHRRRHRWRREAVGAFGDAQVPRHRDGPAGGERRHGRARRQGHPAGPAQLSRPQLPGRAGRHHGRRREHPHALADHLRPGRDPLPSVRAQGNERGAQPDRKQASTNSTARCSATSASPSATPCAPSSWR